ncbi:MAG: lysylphosphatidylglycerol synthase transmembrane domain-containing protein [Candidatus Bathyarchaeia archaeon]
MVNTKKLKLLIQLIVGMAILAWLLRIANLKDMPAILQQINPINLMAAACLFLTASTFVALALYAPLKCSNPKLSLWKVTMASFAGQLLSDITPFRSGYFLTPLFLNSLADVPFEQGVVGVFTTGGINAIVKVAICLIGMAYFASFLPLSIGIINAITTGVLILFVGGILLILIMWEKHFSILAIKFEKLPLIGGKIKGLTKIFNSIHKESRKIKSSFISVALFVVLSLLCNAAALYFIFNGLWNCNIGLIDFFFIASIASTLTYIPITIAGLGVQEAGYVILLSLLLKLPINPNFIDTRLMAFALITRALFTGTDIVGVGPLLKIGAVLKKQNTLENGGC